MIATEPLVQPWHTHEDVYDALTHAPLVPTVMPMPGVQLAAYVELLAQAKYPVIEVLCRPAEQALPLVEELFESRHRHTIRWGIGTIRDAATAQRVVALRPDFMVSPAFSRRVLDVAVEAGVPYVPAVHTFQDVQDVLDAFDDHGLHVRVLKLCPIYGLSNDYVQSLRGCFPGITFCPTGEVTIENYATWRGMVGAGAPMGRRLIPPDAVACGDSKTITHLLDFYRCLAEHAKPSHS